MRFARDTEALGFFAARKDQFARFSANERTRVGERSFTCLGFAKGRECPLRKRGIGYDLGNRDMRGAVKRRTSRAVRVGGLWPGPAIGRERV